MDTIVVPFITDSKRAHTPKRAHPTDAGYDLATVEAHEFVPHERRLVDTGLALEIPEGYCGLIFPRSGLALKKGLTVLNAPGLIDSGYRGNIKVLLWSTNQDGTVVEIDEGERIAQLVVIPTIAVDFTRAAWLHRSDRAERGFGSTGQTWDGPTLLGGDAA